MVQKAIPGVPLVVKAPEYNAAMEAGEWFKGRQLGAPKVRDLGGVNPCTVKVRNDTGGDLSAGDVVAITASELTAPDRQHLWFTGGVPTWGAAYGVLLEPIPNDAMGVAQVTGACLANVSVGDADHEWVHLEDGSTTLKSDFGGTARIAWKPSGTGAKQCVVELGRPGGPRRAGANESIAAGDSGSVSVYDSGSLGIIDEAYNDWADSADLVNGDELVIEWFDADGKWRIRPISAPLLVDAIALATFCTDPDQPTVACDTLIPYGDFASDMFDGVTVEAEIGYGLEGCEGDHLMLAWQPRSQYKWKVVQVDHRAQNVVQSAQYSDCSLVFTKKAIRAVNCCPGTTTDAITMYEHTYYSDVELLAEYTEGMTPESSTCEVKLRGRVSTICGFEPQSSGTLTTLDTLSLTGAQVGGPVTDDGICLQQTSRWVWVICATAESDAVDIICTEECGE